MDRKEETGLGRMGWIKGTMRPAEQDLEEEELRLLGALPSGLALC